MDAALDGIKETITVAPTRVPLLKDCLNSTITSDQKNSLIALIILKDVDNRGVHQSI
jgi:hypothetical protein